MANEGSISWPPELGDDTPKICVGCNSRADADAMRQLKQVGVNYILMGGGPIPWDESELCARMDHLKSGGLTICNMMISGFPDVIYGGPDRDEQIEKVIQSIRVAGKVGLPVIEYNFYANRLMEGYKEEVGRAGAGYTAYDYSLSKGGDTEGICQRQLFSPSLTSSVF